MKRLSSQVRVLLIVDTPNITKSVIQQNGDLVRPDYRRLIEQARSFGLLVAAVALVNDGVNSTFSNCLRSMGYRVQPSHAFDCDDAVVAWTVRFHKQADCVMICSGDRGYCALITLLKAIQRRIVLCAVSGSCSQTLKNLSDEYIEAPIFNRRQTQLPESKQAYTREQVRIQKKSTADAVLIPSTYFGGYTNDRNVSNV